MMMFAKDSDISTIKKSVNGTGIPRRSTIQNNFMEDFVWCCNVNTGKEEEAKWEEIDENMSKTIEE